MTRLKLAQKEFDTIKRTTERIVVSVGGSFFDAKGGKFIKSKYISKRGEFRIDWHSSYSNTASIKNVKVQVLKHFEGWGLDRKQVRQQKGLRLYTGSIEDLIIENWYEEIDRHFAKLEVGLDDE